MPRRKSNSHTLTLKYYKSYLQTGAQEKEFTVIIEMKLKEKEVDQLLFESSLVHMQQYE